MSNIFYAGEIVEDNNKILEELEKCGSASGTPLKDCKIVQSGVV
jgi:hypothetical protein